MKTLALVFALLSLPAVSRAQDCQPVDLRNAADTAAFASIDISGGAVTTAAFPANLYSQLRFRFVLTDADSSVTNLRITLTESGSKTGSFGVEPDCSVAAGVFTCVVARVDWNPANGKTFNLPWPNLAGQWIKLTVTPTGHGAGDAITATLHGCY